jgi:ubiquinone/menaquinone biosynthesis C-methylase UbiE
MNIAKKIIDCNEYTPTLNRMGYMSPSLDKIQSSFVNYCKTHKNELFLDIGCGFGVATIPVLEEGCRIVACDLEKQHLHVLKSRTPREKLHLATFVPGHFPNEVLFPENYFQGINFSMVLHFFPFQTIDRALQKIFYNLKEGGRLFLTTSSPYQKTLFSFIPLYEKRRGREEWPGYIPDIAEYVPHRAHLLPKENIVFCTQELSRLMSKFNFRVLESTFFSREGIPPDLSLDGREYAGIVCEKPKKRVFLS